MPGKSKKGGGLEVGSAYKMKGSPMQRNFGIEKDSAIKALAPGQHPNVGRGSGSRAPGQRPNVGRGGNRRRR